MKKILLLACLITSILSCKNNKVKDDATLEKPLTDPVKIADSIRVEELVKKGNAIKANRDFYNKAKDKLETITDIYNSNSKSIYLNGTNVKTLTDVVTVITMFEDAAILTTKSNVPDSTKKILSVLKSTLIKAQQKNFPLLRQKFAKFTGNNLWENNITVTSSGTSIYFIGGAFANNKNIKDVQEKISESLVKLRFKKSNYQWYKGSETTYYNISSKKDSEL